MSIDNNILNETIAAISTPPGTGAIGIVRITGRDALAITEKIFKGAKKVSEISTHTVEFGKIINPQNNEIIDVVLVNVMHSPRTYTGFDTVEINCHGGVMTTKRILELALQNGARMAEPGEFTKLAFLNGKIDLSQVEAVADLIHAKTETARRSSLNQFLGNLSSEVKSLRGDLLQLCTLLELDVDFGEEHLIHIDTEIINQKIETIIKRIHELLSTYNVGHLLRDGAKVAIVGKPNVGKSSLLNALLKKERAIVSETPGTTRDFIEESIDINGIPFTFVDTAGLRHSEDRIEKMGMNNTIDLMQSSDLVLMMIDRSKPLDDDDKKILKIILDYHRDNPAKKMIIVQNKTDLGDSSETHPRLDEFTSVRISVKTRYGLDTLKDTISRHFEFHISPESPVITKLRHKISLEKSLEFLNSAQRSLNQRISYEYLSFDIRNAISSLNEIIGTITSEDILKSIFSSFCIGK